MAMKITWLDINASYSHSSLALPALEAQLTPQTRSKCTFHIVSGTIKTPIDQIIVETLDSKPDYIFATVWLFNKEYLISALSKINALDNKIKIVLGGPEFLGNNEEFLTANHFITAIFKGEGEEIFNRFIDIISSNPSSKEWLDIEGFEYVKEKVYHNSQQVVVSDFKTLVPPEKSIHFRWDKAFVQLETSRGCFNSCRFCVSGIDSTPLQDISIATIRERLIYIFSKGIKEIRILDRTFNGNSKRAVEMLSLFEEFNGKLKFHLEVHPALLSPDMKKKISSLPEGLIHIEAGIQSLNEKVLDGCLRRGSAQKALEGLKFLLSCSKFEVHTDFIAGLPGYSFDMLLNDLKSMMSVSPHEIQLELLKLLPGTYFRINAKECGIAYSPYPPYEVMNTDSLSFNETIKCKVLSKMVEYWYNDSNWRLIFRDFVMTEETFLENLLNELCKTQFYETLHSFESKSMLLYNFCKINYPQFKDLITINWINCGLSLKKEPASGVVHWNIKDKEQIHNPLFIEEKFTNSYYYFDYKDIRYWFTFNKSEDRCKPTATCRENINNCK